ncbi:ATPase domain-containing protein [Methanolobus bombayensis]|uniref:ATPase domain-containing protein n=1 Tax=Methanolobus bombayensis TaxID=38023 RepID=UPI001AE4AA50|nr:KaiC/GvpD/RAD55 family RecA-like ATPase [Methanolobus bombayensis]
MEGETVLLTGEPGTGKTLFAIHFLYKACMDGKKCAMLATEENPEKIIFHGKTIGRDIEPFVENKQLTMVRVLERRIEGIDDKYANITTNSTDPRKIKFLIPEDTEIIVFDNIGTFSIGQDLKDFRDQIDTLVYIFSQSKWTGLIVMDKTAHELTHRIAEYSTYGTIHLMIKENPYTGKMERYLYIPKMRDTEISLDIVNYNISKEGIRLLTPKTNR